MENTDYFTPLTGGVRGFTKSMRAQGHKDTDTINEQYHKSGYRDQGGRRSS